MRPFLSARFAGIFSSAFSGDLAAAVTTVAIPLLIVGPLDAGDGTVGIAVAADDIGWLIAGPIAGVLIDRFGFRALLIGSEVVRFAAFAAIVVLGLVGVLHPALLIGLLIVKSLASVFFLIGSPTLLATGIVGADLVKANSALTWSGSVAMILGPPLAGVMVGFADPQTAIVVTAACYLVSFIILAAVLRGPGWSLSKVASDSQSSAVSAFLRNFVADFIAGWRYLRSRNDIVRIVASSAQFNFALSLQQAVLVVYLLTLPGFTPGLIGLALGAAGFGGVCAAMSADVIARRFGDSAVVFWTMLAGTALGALVPATTSATGVVFLVTGYFGLSVATVVFGAITGAYRQRTIPVILLGRVTAASRLISWGISPLGALAGGGIAVLVGPWWGLAVAAVVFLGSPFWLLGLTWEVSATEEGANAYP